METTFDTDLIVARKLRALRQSGDSADFLMRQAADDLALRLSTIDRRFERAATLHCWSALPAAVLRDSGKVDDIVRLEAASAFAGTTGIVAPLETVAFQPGSLDLAVSLLSMQDLNDIPGFLIQVRRALKPDGLFLGAMAGADTLSQLRASLLAADAVINDGASPRVAPFADIRDIGALLQRAGFALPVTDVETLTVRYDDVFGLVRDLRAMGATSALTARKRIPDGRALFGAAAQTYAERYADADGRIRATFSLIWMSGWAPHASQPQPLKPGSATTSLAQALSRAEDEKG